MDVAVNYITDKLGITAGPSLDEQPKEEQKKATDKDKLRNSDDQFYTYLAYKGLKSVKAIELNKRKQMEDLKGCTFVPKIKNLPGGRKTPRGPQVFTFEEAGNPSTQPKPLRERAKTARGKRDDSNDGAKPVHLRLAAHKRDIAKIKKE